MMYFTVGSFILSCQTQTFLSGPSRDMGGLTACPTQAMSEASRYVRPDAKKSHNNSWLTCCSDMFPFSCSNHSSSRSGWTFQGSSMGWNSFLPSCASTHSLWKKFPTPLGVEMMRARPPVDSVLYRPFHISSKWSTWAASSTIMSDRASERPASSVVGMAVMREFDGSPKTIDVLLSSATLGRTSHLGRLFMTVLTFLTKFMAVGCSLVAMMTISLFLWKRRSQAEYAAARVDSPSWRDLLTMTNLFSRNARTQSSWNGYVSNGTGPLIGCETLAYVLKK